MNLPDPEEFKFKDVIIGGDECVLITPNNITAKWEKNNLHFRSIIIRKSDHKCVSRGFGKFFNGSEKPDLDPFPDGPFTAVTKMDGSLIIWGIHNGELIHRTRGTANVESMANGHEIDFLKQKYPLLIAAIKINPAYSILTEWQTLTNVIVIRDFTEPTLTLVGVIHNETGVLVSQDELDERAQAWGLARPQRHQYSSLVELAMDVKIWEGSEGIVTYSQCGQKLRKWKSDWYTRIHALKSGMKNMEGVLDLFMVSPKFTQYSKFYEYTEEHVDFEVAEHCKDFILEITVAYSKIVDKIENLKTFISQIKTGFTRKEQAQEIQKNFSDWRVPAGFSMLDDKDLDDKIIRKAILCELQS